MKRIVISLALIVSFVFTSCGSEGASTNGNQTSQKSKQGTYSNVSVTDLNTAASSDDIVILDVRTPGEVSQGHVQNSINMDINGRTFSQQADKLDKSKTVYVYCRSGHRSQTASKALVKMGFTDVRNVEGGFLAWEQKGYKSVK